ncbi:MobC family plasmid mobilization relaxosome protein [Ruminococcaceae bacterium OttesenSCG-928-L11]|nr:MobC family plasmid mobilization relaxosome protein [Ruminococcaceae bacterium OttesenSCG-928-L11]
MGAKRNVMLAIRVTEEERRQIARRMEQAGVRSLRAFVLKMAVDGYIVNLDLSDVHEMVSLLRRSSNNLNQIAKRVNETRSIYEADIQDLREHYDKLWEQANRILKGLAKL